MAWEVPSKVSGLVKELSRSLGFDIVREKNSPRRTMLGLRSRPITSIIDVGANRGQFAAIMRRVFPQARIWSFEPLEDPYRVLEKWAAEQDGLVNCFNVAVGDAAGAININRHLQHSPSSSVLATTSFAEALLPQTGPQQSVTVEVTTLDLALKPIVDHMYPEILLKLDVQGYEDRVLAGSGGLLQRVDHVLLEANLVALYDGQASFSDLVSTLANYGLLYRGNLAQAYRDDGSVMWCDAMFSRDLIEKRG